MCFYTITNLYMSFLGGSVGKESAFRRHGFDSWVGKIPWSRKWQLTPVFLPGKSHGQRSLVGYRPWGHKEPDTTEHTPICLLLELVYIVSPDYLASQYIFCINSPLILEQQELELPRSITCMQFWGTNNYTLQYCWN